MKLFELFATLGLDTSGFEKGVKGAQSQMSGLASAAGKAVKGVGSGVLSVGKTVANTATSIIDTMQKAVTTLAVAGGGAMITMGTQAVQAAADIAAENAAFEATFGTMADEAKSAYAVIGEQANILDTRLQKTATKGFSQLKGAGLSANDALEASTRLLNLAADGAAYYDTSLENVDERLRSFLRGNVEAGDSIGLFTSELQRNNKATELYGKKWEKLTEAQRQMVMLDIAEEIYEQSGVIGQAARESEGWANVIENLKEAWRQTLGVIGTPIMDNLTPIIQKITTYLSEHKDDLGGFADRLGIIVNLLTTGHEPEAIRAASRMITSFIDTINRELQNGEFEKKGQEIFDSLQLAFTRGIAALSDTIELIGPEILAGIVEIKADLLVAGIELIGSLAEGIAKNQTDFTETVSTVVQKVADAVETNAPKMVAGAGALLLALAEGLTTEESLAGISGAIESMIDSVIEWISAPGNTAKLTKAFGELIEASISGAFKAIAEDPMGIAYAILSPFATILDALTGGILDIQEHLDIAYGTWKAMNGEGEIVGTGLSEQIGETESAVKALDEATKNASTTFENAEETFGGVSGSFGEAAQAAETLQGAIEDVEASEAQLEEQVDETTQAILNMFPGADTSKVEGNINAVSAALSGLIAKAAAATAAIGAIFARTETINSLAGGGYFATGLERVPYDGFPAVLHKDEMVLDRQDANAYRNGSANGPERGGVTVVQNIQAVPQTASELAFQTMNALEMLRFSV